MMLNITMLMNIKFNVFYSTFRPLPTFLFLSRFYVFNVFLF